jgi:hypothetical protein
MLFKRYPSPQIIHTDIEKENELNERKMKPFEVRLKGTKKAKKEMSA